MSIPRWRCFAGHHRCGKKGSLDGTGPHGRIFAVWESHELRQRMLQMGVHPIRSWQNMRQMAELAADPFS